MRRIALLCVILMGMAAWCGPLRADTVPSHRYATHDGLPSEQILSLAQTNNGLLWIGTRNGLAVYDGNEFRSIPTPDSIRQKQVFGLQPMPDGSVWAAIGHDAMRVTPHGITRVSLLGNHLNSEVLRRGASVLFVTDRSVWTLEPDSPPTRTPFRFADGTGMTVVRGADVGPEGRLWIVTGPTGLTRVQSDGTVAHSAAITAEGGESFSDVQFIGDGTALTVRGGTMYRFDPGNLTLNRVAPTYGASSIEYRDGSTAYLTGAPPVSRYDTEAHRLQPPLPIDWDTETGTTAVLRGREGGLWVGTENGLLHVANPKARHRRSLAGTAIQNGMGFRERGRVLWGSTWGAGLFQIQPRRERAAPVGYSQWVTLPSHDDRFHALGTDADVDGRTWFQWTSAQGWERVGHVQGGVRGYVDSSGVGYFWHNDGLYRHEPAGDTTEATQLRSWPLNDSQHHLMGPAPNGDVILFDEGIVLRLRRPDGAVIDTIATAPAHAESQGRRLQIDPKGRIWCPFRGGGLLRVDPERGTTHTLLEGVLIEAVEMSGDSLAMAKTTQGLYLLDAETGATRRHFTEADGLLSNDVNGAALMGDTLYVGHTSGITLLPANSLFRAPPRPQAVLKGLEVNFDERSLRSASEWEASARAVGFSYTAASLARAERVQYEVQLAPSESTWKTTDRRFARYTNLASGTYHFKVRARLTGRPPGPAATHTFTIPPHFYETTWFRILVVLCVLGLAGGVYRWRTHRLRTQQARLQRAVDNRTQELIAEKEKNKQQAERLAELDEAKNRFFAHLTHEFRTPLSLVLSPLRDALQRAEEGRVALGGRQIRRMIQNAERLQHLIDQLLDLATLEAGRMDLERRPGNLSHQVRRTAEAFRSKAEQKEIDLRVEVTDRIETRFDPDKVETIVSNLVGNAVKFTPTGGTVAVRVDRADETASVEALGAEGAVEGGVRIAVDDTGPGISPEMQEQIFNRFEQARLRSESASQEHEGVGLGLALTSELVDLHGGVIDVESTPGEGSRFTVLLPLVPVAGGDGAGGDGAMGDGAWHQHAELDAPSDADERTQSATVWVPDVQSAEDGGTENGREEHSEERETILVVEDNAEMRAYLREQFSDSWTVIEATDGEEGWQMVRDREPDLVLSDVMMPSVDGFELCRRIKAEADLRTIPVLLLTARADEEGTREGLACGADDYVAKPFDVTELRRRINNHLAARRHLRARYRQEVEIASTVVDDEDRPFIEDLLAVIDEHLSNPDFTVGRLAEEMALSRRQLTRRVKKATGDPTGTLLRKRRIERAKAMLSENPGTVAEVAYAVGFKSASAFSQSFQKMVGQSPTEYVRQCAE